MNHKQNRSQRRTTETVQHALSNGTVGTTTVQPHFHHNQSADTQATTMSDDLCKNLRDRLGLWGTTADSEVAGNVTGLERLQSARFNKVNLIKLFCLQFFFSLLRRKISDFHNCIQVESYNMFDVRLRFFLSIE